MKVKFAGKEAAKREGFQKERTAKAKDLKHETAGHPWETPPTAPFTILAGSYLRTQSFRNSRRW